MAKTIAVIDSRQSQFILRRMLLGEGYAVVTAGGGDGSLDKLDVSTVDLALVDLNLGEGSGSKGGLELLMEWKPRHDFPVIMTTPTPELEDIRAAIRHGAYDTIVKPFSREVVLPVVRTALERSQVLRQRHFRRDDGPRSSLGDLVGTSPHMTELRDLIRKVAPHGDTSVLVLGESGTGKEMVAKAIHAESPRSDRPFVAINCGAIPKHLVEAELFGHEKGAFTGADHAKEGRFERANGGTLFLDEIGEMPLDTQVKLLRVLEERKVARVGSERERSVDIRIVAATNTELHKAVDDGLFRADLFYRLNVIQVAMPPLRDRGADIRLLVEHFVQEMAGQALPVGRSTDAALRRYPWPGNVRELRNAVERSIVLAGARPDEFERRLSAYCSAEGHKVSASTILPVEAAPSPTPATDATGDLEERLTDLLRQVVVSRAGRATTNLLQSTEDKLVTIAYAEAGGNKAKAARLLGIERKALERRLRRARAKGQADET